MPPRYQLLGGAAVSGGPSAPARRWLDPLTRRPIRIVALALAAFCTLSLFSWLGFSDTGAQHAQQWRQAAKSAGAQATAWAAGPWQRPHAPGTEPPSASPRPATTTKVPGGEISPADWLYSAPAGVPPVSVEELASWGEKGDDGNLYPPVFIPAAANKAPRAKAGFIVLVRNEELKDMLSSMRDVEEKFNRKFGYPWIFLNDKDFTDEFKKSVRAMTRSEIRFGKVGPEHWGYPAWINQTKAAETREKMKDIIYGSSESYRHMCRFQSGFFFKHPLTLDLEWYWRVEPGIHLYCDIDYDPFLFMQMNNKTYGFTMAVHEYPDTIPTLWDETKKFMKQHPQFLAKDHGLHFMTDEPERLLEPGYNMCHFWSNFEIGDLRFWRGEAYQKYFEHLDKAGGFFYERWGDAPVHSIAAVLFLDRSKIAWLDDIGYYHVPYMHCPANRAKYHDNGKCACDPKDSADLDGYSCLKEWWRTSIEGPPK